MLLCRTQLQPQVNLYRITLLQVFFLRPASFRTLFDHGADLLDAIASDTSDVYVRSSDVEIAAHPARQTATPPLPQCRFPTDKQFARGEYGAREIRRPAQFADAATKCTRGHILGAG